MNKLTHEDAHCHYNNSQTGQRGLPKADALMHCEQTCTETLGRRTPYQTMRERAGQMQCMAQQLWYMFGAVLVQVWCIRALARPLARERARTKTLARGFGSLARA